MTRVAPWRALLTVLLATVALVGAACGSDQVDTSDQAAPTATQSEGAEAPAGDSASEPAAPADDATEPEPETEPEPKAEETGDDGADESVTSSQPPASTAAPADSSSSSTSTSSTTTTEAPAGDLVDLVGGGQLDLNSIEGQDTVLWFWAPW